MEFTRSGLATHGLTTFVSVELLAGDLLIRQRDQLIAAAGHADGDCLQGAS